MSIILSGLIHLFRPLLSSLSGALDCEGLGPWYFLLGLRIVAIFFSNGPWDKAKEDLTCNWVQPVPEKSVAFCTALCHNQHFATSVSATWGLVFLLNLLYVGLMRLSSPEEKKENEKEDDKDKDKGRGLSVVATASHSGAPDISTVYTVGRHGLPANNGYDEGDDDDGYGDGYDDEYHDFPNHPYHHHHPYRARWHRPDMGPMGEGYGSIVPFGPYRTGGYGMPGGGVYGMPGEGGYSAPSDGGYSVPSDGGYSMPSEGGYSILAEVGHVVPGEGGHVMPDDEGRSVPANEGPGVSASGGYNVPADGGYGMPIHPGHNGKTKMPAHSYNTAQSNMGVGPVDCRQTKMAAHQHNAPPLQGRIKQTRAAFHCDETGQYKVPTKCVPVSSPYRRKYKMATKCRPVIESNLDSKENVALKRRQVHRNNMPNKSQVGFRNPAPVQQQLAQDTKMAAQSRPSGGQRMAPGPGVSTGPPFCCHNDAGCPCPENNSCCSATQGEPLRQPSSGNSGPGSQEKAKRAITNLCGIPFFDIWVGFLLATEIAFLCVIIVLQMPSLLTRLWVCNPRAATCPPSVECVVRGRAEKRVALWGLVLTCCLFIVACSGYFYLRTCWNKGCRKCCDEEVRENRGEANTEPGGRVPRGDVEGGGRQTGGGQ
ncbi:PREDICTED: uncharacterized protein LOC107117619 [Gekko japonicus]|uniref:Uncharacterized protein LOC107117619 n=1 Tax=Gekko japonicus TaxID=146911 RepID=A0ABM1KNG6_GEKJA|nr:PREDICTED: uncharacterized protein LOC107117619 [Gekko japonicus]